MPPWHEFITTQEIEKSIEMADLKVVERRGPGRPMSVDVERRLHKAALKALSDYGPSGMSVEKIAELAGVPRSTFYRRWATATEAVAAAVGAGMDEANPEAPATGDLKKDMIILMQNFIHILERRYYARALMFLIGESGTNSSARDVWLQVVTHRRAYPARILENAKKSKQISESIDVEMFINILVGPIFHRLYSGGGLPDDTYVESVVTILFDGLKRKK